MILNEKEIKEIREKKVRHLPYEVIKELAKLPRGFVCFQMRKGIPIEEMYHRTKVIFLAMNDPYQLSLTTHEIEGMADLGMNSAIRYPGRNMIHAVSMARLKRKLAGRKANHTRKMKVLDEWLSLGKRPTYEQVREWLSLNKRWVE